MCINYEIKKSEFKNHFPKIFSYMFMYTISSTIHRNFLYKHMKIKIQKNRKLSTTVMFVSFNKKKKIHNRYIKVIYV